MPDHASHHGFGGPDELDVRALARGGTPTGLKFLRDDGTWQVIPPGTELWTYSGGNLYPTTNPSSDCSITVGNSINLTAGGDVILEAADDVRINPEDDIHMGEVGDLIDSLFVRAATQVSLDVNGHVVLLSSAGALTLDGANVLVTPGAWTSWSPSITQSGSVTYTGTGKYEKVGRSVRYAGVFNITSAGTGGVIVKIGAPVTAAAANVPTGTGWIYDLSVTTNYRGPVNLWDTSTFSIVSAGNGGMGANEFTAALASGDVISIAGTYEAAS